MSERLPIIGEMGAQGGDKRRRTIRTAGLAVLILVIVIFLLLLAFCQKPVSVEATHPLDGAPTLALGDAVVTGFSGTLEPDPAKALPAGKAVADQTFIDGNGPSVRIFDPRKPGSVWSGEYWAAPHKRDIPARSVGQVFGVTIDDLAYPDIYLTATSAYGLNIVTPDKDGDGLPERVRSGRVNAGWAPGQFGPGGGPGSIWKIDGRSGQILHFADVTLDRKVSGPAALGNIAYDAAYRQLFVSDLSTGMIHRFGLNGADLGHFDHGLTGRAAAGLPRVPYDPATRADIANAKFNTEDPRTWGFAPPERRVWGLAIHEDRLYYAVAAGQIWSTGLTRQGDFAGDPRLEISLPDDAKPAPVSDIVFTHDGTMIVAQRAVIGTAYDYKALPPGGIAHVYRFWREKPNDPKTASQWYQAPEEYAVGYGGDSRSSGGGIALGYGYDSKGEINLTDCEDAVFFTGDDLRTYHQQKDEFIPDGKLRAEGLQISPKGPVRGFNVPPSISYFVNYADHMTSASRAGTVGDVVVYRLGCATGACGVAPVAEITKERLPVAAVPGNPPPGPPGGPPPGTPSGCVGIDCIPVPVCIGPDCPPCIGSDCGPVEPQICMKVEGEAVCDPDEGGYIFKIVTQDTSGIGINMLTAHSTTSGVNVGNGPDISVSPPPGVILLNGATPGQTVMIDVCGFDAAARQTGKPYDCCRETLTLQVPQEICQPVEGFKP